MAVDPLPIPLQWDARRGELPPSVPSTLQPTAYTLHPTPYTLHPTPSTLNNEPSSLKHKLKP